MNHLIITTHADHNPLIVALREEGVDVRHFEWGRPLPDLSGCLAFYGNLFDEIKDWFGLIKLKQQLRRQQIPYVFWNRDAPWNTGMKLQNRLAMQWLKPVDIYLTHSMQNWSWFGGEPHYFPNAAQPAYFRNTDLNALNDEASYAYDVSFYGSFGNGKDLSARARYEFLLSLEDRLKQDCSGIRFKAIDTTKDALSLDEQLTFIRRSKINLNYGAMCDLPGELSWGLPERVFGIPAAGGFLLTEQRQTLASTFHTPPLSFHNLDTCVQQIKTVIPDLPGLRARAEAVHRDVLQAHTYGQRAKQFLQIIANFHKAKTVNS